MPSSYAPNVTHYVTLREESFGEINRGGDFATNGWRAKEDSLLQAIISSRPR